MTALLKPIQSSVNIMPIQYSQFQDIDQVRPINDSDSECLAEIRDVLKKHERLDRFGVALLHTHFDLNDDEIMLERESGGRTLVIEAVKASENDTQKVGTIWALREGSIETMSWCRQYCSRGLLGHSGQHNVED